MDMIRLRQKWEYAKVTGTYAQNLNHCPVSWEQAGGECWELVSVYVDEKAQTVTGFFKRPVD